MVLDSTLGLFALKKIATLGLCKRMFVSTKDAVIACFREPGVKALSPIALTQNKLCDRQINRRRHLQIGLLPRHNLHWQATGLK